MSNYRVNLVLWAVYISLLGVLLPHTAWAFSRFENPSPGWSGLQWGTVVAVAGAFAFEAAIAALTHKLAVHISHTPRYTAGRVRWRRLGFRYLNVYAVGLFAAVGVSGLANLAHAVEYGQRLAVFDEWGVPPAAYALAFGAVLPLVSLLFARVLSNVAETEHDRDDELVQLRRELREAERRADQAERRAEQAEQRFDAAGDVFVRLMSDQKRERILAARELYPQLPASTIAVMADASRSYVTEVLNAEED